MMKKVFYMCGAALSEYIESGTDRDERHLKSIYVRENIACTSKVELPYYSVDNYPVVCSNPQWSSIQNAMPAPNNPTFSDVSERL